MYCTVWLRLFKILPSSLWWVNSYEILEKKDAASIPNARPISEQTLYNVKICPSNTLNSYGKF